jgi:hypothetical protein
MSKKPIRTYFQAKDGITLDKPQNSFHEFIDKKEIDINNLELDLRVAKYPDAKLHQIVSFIKSGIRIVGYAFIPFNLTVACVILVGSELIGIYEELV